MLQLVTSALSNDGYRHINTSPTVEFGQAEQPSRWNDKNMDVWLVAVCRLRDSDGESVSFSPQAGEMFVESHVSIPQASWPEFLRHQRRGSCFCHLENSLSYINVYTRFTFV